MTVIGQSDGNRKFHLIAIGIATHSTQEIGEIFFVALLSSVPDLLPTAYLGDGAEAFANAAKVVWPGIDRLMCYAHVYKVRLMCCSVA